MTELQGSEQETKQLSKLDLKKRQIYLERRQRALNKGVPAEEVDAVLAREDFERLPLEVRVRHLIDGSMKQIAGDMQGLHYNDSLLAAAMDVNFRAIASMLEKLGIPKEEQLAALQTAREATERELKEREVAAAAAAEQKAATTIKEATEQAGTPVEPPEDATIFGG